MDAGRLAGGTRRGAMMLYDPSGRPWPRHGVVLGPDGNPLPRSRRRPGPRHFDLDAAIREVNGEDDDGIFARSDLWPVKARIRYGFRDARPNGPPAKLTRWRRLGLSLRRLFGRPEPRRRIAMVGPVP